MPTREHELSSYKIQWARQPREQVVEEFTSYCLETRRVPDPYYFILTPDGRLFSPSKKAPVEESVETKSYLGKIEKQAFDQIERWARENNEGIIVWISPPFPGQYPVSKIIISELAKTNGVKILFNRAVVLDISAQDCLKLAFSLSLASGRNAAFFSPDGLRAHPITLKYPSNVHWTYILGGFIDIPDVWESIRRGEDLKIKREFLLSVRRLIEEWFGGNNPSGGESFTKRVYEMNLLGASAVSCPPILARPTAFGIFFENARLFFESSFPCPKCERPIPSGRGIVICPHCGAKKEDHGRCV